MCKTAISKPNLTCSFMGVSACFCNVSADVHSERHCVIVIDLSHPHTGDCLADAIEKCLKNWSISKEKVIMIISDNGSNMIKAIRLMSERAERATFVVSVNLPRQPVMLKLIKTCRQV